MYITHLRPLNRRIALATLLTALVASGCGDAGMFSRGEFRERTEARAGSTLEGADVAVDRVSARCDDDEAGTCPKGTTPDVEVYVESRSVIFDFSNVAAPGSFPTGDFDGFVIEVPGDKPILHAQVDEESTNLELDDSAIVYGEGFVEVDFAGVAFDDTGFVEIELLVGPLKLLRHGD